MSKNIDQVYTDNPITTNNSDDLMYFGQSPYGADDDAAMLYSDFAAQFGGGGITSQQVQQSAFNVGIDTGTSTAYEVDLSPTVTSYTDGLLVAFTPANSNSIILPTLNINGLGDQGITPGFDNGFCMIGDLNQNTLSYLIYSVTMNGFILLNPQLSIPASKDMLTGNGFWTNVDASITLNDYEVSLPVSTAYGILEVKPIFCVLQGAHATNTGASTFTITGIPSLDLLDPNGNVLIAGQIVAGQDYYLFFDSIAYRVLNPSAGVSPQTIQNATYIKGSDTGSADAYTVDLNPAVVSYTDGLTVYFTPGNTNLTTAPTLDVNGVGATVITRTALTPVSVGDLSTSQLALCIYCSVLNEFLLLNPAI